MSRNRWREHVLDEYRAAREAWELQRELVCLGYATEEAEYGSGPTFREFLVGMRGSLMFGVPIVEVQP